jgi:hypothetical protein
MRNDEARAVTTPSADYNRGYADGMAAQGDWQREAIALRRVLHKIRTAPTLLEARSLADVALLPKIVEAPVRALIHD